MVMMDINELNEQQRKAVESESPRLLILAGAGSGKTHTVISKIVHLIGSGAAYPDQILALTFSNKAANEMKERILSGLDIDGERIFVKTFHKLGSFILRRYGDLIGLSDFNIYTPDESIDLLKSACPEMLKKDLKGIVNSILDAKDRGYDSDTYAEWEDANEEWTKYFRKYEEALSRTGCVDFADLINLSCRILSEHEVVKQELQRRWRHVFVDEYQDTNAKQFELLLHLIGDDTHLCAVGDDDQSIYAFRGAENEHILNFTSNFPDAEVIKLEQNYRSTKSILALSNSLIKENIHRSDKVLWTENPEGEKPKLLIYSGNGEEERFTARMVEEFLPLGSVCIIYRNNSQSAGFEAELMKKGIPCSVFKGNSFFSKEEVKDCIAYFSLALNPKDLSNFMRILPKPPRGIGKKTVDAIVLDLLSSDRDVISTALDSLAVKPAQRAELEKLRDLISEANSALASGDVKTFCSKLVIDTGLLKMYEEDNRISFDSDLRRNETTDETLRQNNIRKFIQIIDESGGIRNAEDFRAYLEGISLSSQTDVSKMQGVVLSSMHSVKGLEFDTCFVTGLEAEIIPSCRGNDIEEERRLLYVAMTRAKRRLYLSYSESRFRNGMYSSASPSEFIDDLDPDKFETKNLGQLYRSYRSASSERSRSSGSRFLSNHSSRRTSSGSASGWRKGASSFSADASEKAKTAKQREQELLRKSIIIKKTAPVESKLYKIGDEVINTKTSQTGKVIGIRKLQEHVILDILFANGQKTSLSEGSAFIEKK